MPSRVARTALLLPFGWSGRDAFGVAVGACAVVAILVNTLLMQSGSHPAPMFKHKAVATSAAAAPDVAATAPLTKIEMAPLAPATPAKLTSGPPAKPAAPAAVRMPGDIIIDIQRELARRGFFEGAVDGLYGPRTDGAIRDFEQAAGLKSAPEPTEALLQAILRAPAGVSRTTTSTVARPPARVPARNEIERPQPSKRVLAFQRVLADYGYGQIKPTGVVDAETQAAIEKFERERKLPVTGQPSDRVARELAAVTGRPLE